MTDDYDKSMVASISPPWIDFNGLQQNSTTTVHQNGAALIPTMAQNVSKQTVIIECNLSILINST